MRSVAVEADGNCLPRTARYISNDTESVHVEMRVRIVHELIAHRTLYLIDTFLSRGLATEETRNIALRYAQYSPWYVPGVTLTDSDIDQLYKKEVGDVTNTTNSNLAAWWEPNHFVPVYPKRTTCRYTRVMLYM